MDAMNVLFTKNRFPLFTAPKTMAIDGHFHTHYSDGSSKVLSIIRKAKERNVGVAITDHNDIRGAIEAYKNERKTPVIPGIEVNCKGMIHLLIYFYTLNDLKDFFGKYVKPFRRQNHNFSLKEMTALKIAKVAHQYKCIIVLAHPYGGTHRTIESYIKIKGNEKFLSYIDCIEVHNGTVGKRRNLKSLALANRLHKGITGGSDGHLTKALGNTLTICDATNIGTFLDRLKEGKSRVQGKKMGFYQRYKQAGVISYKFLDASTKKHRKEILTSFGIYAIMQRFSIFILFLLGSILFKKVREKKEVVQK